ncbi:acyltransferase [Clostridium sp. C8-1-8]|uniref:acyltransferase family protein n=1 Tax=Clostridium sp. C8-1-8 TaxID=2698831 RepID=UPI00136CA39F|nr:acyltransferase [Clostridium sp. C8-1-8]
METKNSPYYGMVDLLRLVFAIGVMMIHTRALESVNKDLWMATSMGICRLAVPFFFIVSGYFLYKRIQSPKEPSTTLKRLLILYFAWVLIESITLFPIVLSILKLPLIMIIIRFLLIGISGSLWYIASLIITIFIIAPLLKKDKILPLLIIGIILFLFGASADTYYGLFMKTMLGPVIKGYNAIALLPQIGIVESMLFVSIGALIGKYRLNERIKNSGLLSIIFIIVLLVETFILNKSGIAKDANMYLSSIISAPFIFIWATNYKKNISRKVCTLCREYSVGLYCSHQIILLALGAFVPMLFGNTVVRFTLTLCISALIIAILRRTKLKRILLR